MKRDLTGQNFGMLTAVKDVGSRNNRRVWMFRCDCGGLVDRDAISVRSVAKRGGTPNCGCATPGIRAANGRSNRTHGLSATLLYGVFRQMHQRCTNPASKDYPGYGGRGIAVCAEWESIKTFFAWAAASGYRKGLTIERKDNDKGYCPENCVWIPNENQALNTRRLLLLTHDGITAHASFWARKLGMPIRTVIARKRYGWDDHRTLTAPIRGRA